MSPQRNPLRAALAHAQVLFNRTVEVNFVGALARWLAPGGACYLLNNVRRTVLERFESTCAESGLRVERLPDLDGSSLTGVTSMIAPPWDDVDRFCVQRATSARNGSAADSASDAALSMGRVAVHPVFRARVLPW